MLSSTSIACWLTLFDVVDDEDAGSYTGVTTVANLSNEPLECFTRLRAGYVTVHR